MPSTEEFGRIFSALLQDEPAIRRATRKACPRRRGRPPQNNNALLLEIATLVYAKGVREWVAAEVIAARHTGQSFDATQR
jgi:hypothetical protein